ncbi:MAG: nucleotidyltransferase family protein [Selenomonadaceae bacterium]|nr:nucleotidyltransferase family protein [Selenomonadaceae bacterium]
MLNVTAEDIAEADAATCARVLAFNERGRTMLKKFSAPIVTKLTKHLNHRDLCERRRPLEPYQKILLFDVLATDLRALLSEPPRPVQSDFSTPPVFVIKKKPLIKLGAGSSLLYSVCFEVLSFLAQRRATRTAFKKSTPLPSAIWSLISSLKKNHSRGAKIIGLLSSITSWSSA